MKTISLIPTFQTNKKTTNLITFKDFSHKLANNIRQATHNIISANQDSWDQIISKEMNPKNQSQIQNSIKSGRFQSYDKFNIKTEEKRKRKDIRG